MEDMVTCPNCRESNPADLLYCQACQWQLRRLGEDRGSVENSEPQREPDANNEPIEDTNAIPDWLQDLSEDGVHSDSGNGQQREIAPESVPPAPNEDILAGLASRDQPKDEEVPEWIATIMGIKGDREESGAGFTAGQEMIVESPLADDPAGSLETPGQDIDSDLWSSGDSETTDGQGPPMDSNAVQGEAVGSPSLVESDEIYDWVRNLDAGMDQDAVAASETEPKSATTDVPTWVRRLDGIPVIPGKAEPEVPAESLPDWLTYSAAGEDSDQKLREDIPRTPDLPEWLPSPALSDTEMDAQQPEPKIPGQTASTETPQTSPAFSADTLNSLDVDAVFASMQMPDWLADVGPVEPPASRQPPPAAQDEDPLAPAELPSWVQAMRPVDSALTASPGGDERGQIEERGPLLGLHGVLPAVPGAATPSSKTQPRSMRLEVSDQQKAHTVLLEQLLAAETMPVPMKGSTQLQSQASLRWGIGALLIIVLAGSIFTGAKNFPLPAAVPNESVRAMEAVQSIGPDEPVLMAFDFEPATVGEMEATAASVLDHLLLLKHPKLALISTSPTGSVLAERFLSTTLEPRGYQRGLQYVNLGYLPGGLAGVKAFARDPVAAMPIGAGTDRAWESGVLNGMTRLSDFTAIIVLTDGLESGRVWIEQTTDARGSGALILISSAQAGPMLLPYVDSGQAAGLVSGLNGAAGVEMANGGLPGFVRQYWDAYSLGLLIAVILIILGGTWQFWLGLRERRMEQTA